MQTQTYDLKKKTLLASNDMLENVFKLLRHMYHMTSQYCLKCYPTQIA